MAVVQGRANSLQASLVLPRSRKILRLHLRNRQDPEVSLRVDAQQIWTTTDLTGIPAAPHGARRVAVRTRGVVTKVIIAEALTAVLHSGHGIALVDANSNARFNRHVRVIWLSIRHDTAVADVIMVTSLILPAGRN